MFDLGDTVTLVAPTVRDAAGGPANADTVTLVVTLPDGTTDPQTVTNPPAETGQYTHPYIVVQHGRHVARWTFTGSVPDQAYADVFNAASEDWPAIIGLASAKNHLNIPASDTTDDEELRGFILSASRVVEDIVGAVAKQNVVETASGGKRHIVLERSPVDSVTQILADGDLVDAGDYTVSPSGLVALRSGCWPAGLRNIEVTYVAGLPVVPANILDGTKDLIRVNWRPQAGGNYSAFDGGRADDFGQGQIEAAVQGELRLGFFVPNTVTQRLQPDRRGPVVL